MALTKADLKERKKAELEKEQAEFEEKKEKEKIYKEKKEKEKEKKAALEAKQKTEATPKTESQTEITPKKTANNAAGKAQQFSTIANRPAYFSAKAVSSEAEKNYNNLSISPVQRGRQAVGENIARAAGVKQETLDNIKAEAISKFGKDVFSESVDSGVANLISNTVGGLDFLSKLTPAGYVTNKLYGDEHNPLSIINEPIQQWKQKEAAEAMEAAEKTGKGKSAEISSQIITTVTEAIPDIVLSLATMGGSKAVTAVGKGTKALTAAGKGAKALTSAKTFLPAVKQAAVSTVKNPSFWLNFEQMLYPEYEAAIASGASEDEANITALLSAFGQASIESGSGYQKLPDAGANSVRKAVFDYVKSAVEEGNEEVVQSIVSGITQKIVFDHDKDLVSTTSGEDAVFNMADAFDEWLLGTLAGGIMSAPGGLLNTSNTIPAQQNVATGEPTFTPPTAPVTEIPSIAENNIPKVETNVSAEAPVTPVEPPVIETENVTPKTQNEQEGAFANVGETNANKPLAKGVFDKKIGTSRNLATQEDINNYVDYSFEYSNKAKQDPEHLPEKQISQIKYGKTNDRLVNDVESIYGVDVDGYYHTLVDNDIRHIKNSHGEGTNEKYPITAEDIKQIPDIVNNYDNVYVVTKENGSQGIYYEKRHNGTTYYLETIKEGNTLANKQMIKVGTGDIPDIAGLKEEIKKRRTPPAPSGDKPLGYTSETAWEDRSSNNKIPQDEIVVNTENNGTQTGDGGFGENTVGAAQSNPASYAHLQNEYGVFEPGEQPLARDPNVPLKDAQGNRVSQSVRTIMEAKITPDELIPAFEKEVTAGTFQNMGTTNKEAVEKAAQRIANKPFEEAVNEFRTLYSDDKVLSKDDVVFGEVLYSMAAQNGETKTAMELASLLVSNSSRTGDAMQAQRILKRLSPEGRLYHAQRITDKFNKDKHQKNEIKLSEETVKKVLNAKTDEEIEAANDAVAEDIANQIDRGFLNDFAGIVNSWRYFSMLGNPRTHIRNFFGNLAFLPVRKIKNVVKAGIENIAYKEGWIDEKTATVKLASKENRDFAKKSFEKNKKTLLSGGNFRFESEIDSKIEPFRLTGKETPFKKFLNTVLTPARKVAEFNSNALDAEDVLFLKNAYIDSFTQYLTANKIDAQNITPEQITKAENYAAAEAAKATYRDYSAISSALEKLSNTTIPIGKDKKALEIFGIKVKPFKFFVEANIPFRKTPINVTARGIEYSPVGLAKALAVDGYLLKKGDITANEMIDHISSGLTGSGVVALGAALALKGILTAGEKEDENEQAFDELQGKQNYALNIGDGSYTIDWLSPTAIPLFIGAEAVQAAKEEYGDDPKWNQIAYSLLKNLDTIADPILELSMLDNLDKLLSGNYGKGGKAIEGLMKDTATSYVLQLIPALSSQIAQTMDGTRRNAYYVDKTDNIDDDWQELIQRAKAKIPGLSKELPAYVDALGREQKQSDNIGVRILENFISPGFYKKREVTEADEMLKQLFAGTGDSSVLPKKFAKSFEVDGENLNLSGKQYVEASKVAGQTKYDMLNQLVADEDFKKLSSEQKASIVSDVYSYANVKGKQEVSNYTTDTKWYKNIEEAKSKYGISNADYLIAKNAYSNIEGNDKTAKAKMIDQLVADKGTSAKQDVALMEYIAGVDMSKYEKATSEPSKQLALYKIKNDANKNNIEQIQKEFKEDVYGAREIYYKSEGDWNYNIDDVIDNGKNRDKKVPVFERFEFSDKEITQGYNAVIGLNNKDDMINALTYALGSKKKATTFYNILKGKKGYK